MTRKTILALIAVAAVSYYLGTRRGVAAGASQANAGPVSSGSLAWLDWQGGD